MEWTKDTPKIDGFYWLRRKGGKDTPVKVYDCDAGLVEYGAMVAWIGSDRDQSLCEVAKKNECQWFGPIESPGGA